MDEEMCMAAMSNWDWLRVKYRPLSFGEKTLLLFYIGKFSAKIDGKEERIMELIMSNKYGTAKTLPTLTSDDNE